MPFCHQCGYNLAKGIERFCPNCGYNFNRHSEENSKSIDIIDNVRDIIGVGIDGDGNIFWKNVSIVINEFPQYNELVLIHPNCFKENIDIE